MLLILTFHLGCNKETSISIKWWMYGVLSTVSLSEISILSSLSHPSFIHLMDCLSCSSSTFYIMLKLFLYDFPFCSLWFGSHRSLSSKTVWLEGEFALQPLPHPTVSLTQHYPVQQQQQWWCTNLCLCSWVALGHGCLDLSMSASVTMEIGVNLRVGALPGDLTDVEVGRRGRRSQRAGWQTTA